MPTQQEILLIRCPACNIEMEAPVRAAGSPAQCPFCGTGFLVPHASPQNPPAESTRKSSQTSTASSQAAIRRRKPRHRNHSLPAHHAARKGNTVRRRRRQSLAPVIMVPPVIRKTQNHQLEKTMAIVFVIGGLSFGWATATRPEPTPRIEQPLHRPPPLPPGPSLPPRPLLLPPYLSGQPCASRVRMVG